MLRDETNLKHLALDGWLENVGASLAFDALGSLLPDAVMFAVDKDQAVTWWSEGAEKLLGYRAADVLGAHCLTANRCVACSVGCGIQEYDRVRDKALTLYAADGSKVRLRKTAMALRDDDGCFIGGLEVLVPDDAVATESLGSSSDSRRELFHGLLSGDPHVHQVFQAVRNVAETSANTLVRGESGTGKELVARALHAESPRAAGPFVAVNCAALTPSLMESELFGHVRGAFTGALRDRRGLFEQAHGGTLFLDEVAELPLDVQSKLLRVLEQRTVVRVGDDNERQIDVRIISATHQSLRKAVEEGRFREDLMYRLRVVPLYLPPLRERRGDIELLLWHFIGRLNVEGPRVVDRIAPTAMRALLDHRWPGNVRELRNVVEYAFAVGRGEELSRMDLPPELREPATSAPPRPTMALRPPDEATRIRDAIEAAGGHLGDAAHMLGISRPTLWRKRKKYGL